MVRDVSLDSKADFVADGTKVVDALSDPVMGLWFGDIDEPNWVSPKRISFYGGDADMFGFNESIFKASLKRVTPTTAHMKHLYDSIQRVARIAPPHTPANDTEGVLLVLVMLQELSQEGSKGLSEQFMTFCLSKKASGGRSWRFLSDGLAGRLDIDDWEAELCWSDKFLNSLVPLIEEMKGPQSPA
jgi:hypothetical protein